MGFRCARCCTGRCHPTARALRLFAFGWMPLKFGEKFLGKGSIATRYDFLRVACDLEAEGRRNACKRSGEPVRRGSANVPWDLPRI